MQKFVGTIVTIVMAAIIGAAGAWGAGGGHKAPYAGQQTRTIKSLSAEDIDALKNGRGWSFAKPAELNGYPGPLHVLEFEKKLGLDADQKRRIQVIYDEMKAAARKLGVAYLDAERALDDAFAKQTATPESVARLTQEAARLRADLQAVHLQAHLRTTPLLTAHQRHRYSQLRGYAGGHDGSTNTGSHKGHN